MKGYRTQFEQLAKHNTDQAIEIASLKREIRRLASEVDALRSFFNRIQR